MDDLEVPEVPRFQETSIWFLNVAYTYEVHIQYVILVSVYLVI